MNIVIIIVILNKIIDIGIKILIYCNGYLIRIYYIELIGSCFCVRVNILKFGFVYSSVCSSSVVYYSVVLYECFIRNIVVVVVDEIDVVVFVEIRGGIKIGIVWN